METPDLIKDMFFRGNYCCAALGKQITSSNQLDSSKNKCLAVTSSIIPGFSGSPNVIYNRNFLSFNGVLVGSSPLIQDLDVFDEYIRELYNTSPRIEVAQKLLLKISQIPNNQIIDFPKSRKEIANNINHYAKFLKLMTDDSYKIHNHNLCISVNSPNVVKLFVEHIIPHIEKKRFKIKSIRNV